MRFATVAFAQSTLTIWYVAIVLPILILATIVTIWGNQITGRAGKHWASEELRKLPQSEYRLLDDLVLKDSTGLHQIDHVVVSVLWHLRSGDEELCRHDLRRFQIF